jgi:hypothetical protein
MIAYLVYVTFGQRRTQFYIAPVRDFLNPWRSALLFVLLVGARLAFYSANLPLDKI